MSFLKFLRRLVAVILMIIAIVLIIISICISFGAAAPLWAGAIGAALYGASIGYLCSLAFVALILAMWVDPKVTTNVLEDLGEAVGDVANAVGDVLKNIVKGVSDGLGLPSLFLWGIGGYLGFKFLTRKRNQSAPAPA